MLTIKNYETAQRLAGQGIGITFLPMDYAALTYADHPPVLLSIDESYSPSWDLSIATLKGGFLSRADQYFLDLVRRHLPRNLMTNSTSGIFLLSFLYLPICNAPAHKGGMLSHDLNYYTSSNQ